MKKRVIIIGGGISGLAAGWFLNKRFGDTLDLTILEKSPRAGGWIRTIQQEGFLFEQGPRGFRPFGKGEETLSLVRDLGLEQELIAANPKAKKRYLCLNGRLEAASLKLLLKKGLLKAIWRDWQAPASSLEDETIAAFCLRRFPPSLLETFVDPLVKGIFGGDVYQLSCRSCFPSLWELEKKHGSVFRGLLTSRKKKKSALPSLYSFIEGMETLPRALAKALSTHIHFSTSVLSIEERGSRLRLHLSEGGMIDADLILAAIPAPTLARLYPHITSPCHFASLTTVNCGWHGDLLPRHGYGFLVPSKEKEALLGMTWDSDIFQEQNQGVQTRICLMMRGASFEYALQCIQRFLGIHQQPDALLVGEAIEAIPQYTLGHYKRIELLKESLPPSLLLLGNSYEGVSVNDCIAHARHLVESLSLSKFKNLPKPQLS